ncbi:GMC family oxidoreductase [Tsukamurella soli]|uniref:GMC family oxidoreductase n=1 Tax=Tsukamurella soli TaxID=644556 RepID=A0ABP8K8I7_9ACTN
MTVTTPAEIDGLDGDPRITAEYGARPIYDRYDYVIIGAGTSGSVVAGRLIEDTDASVLVIEAGGTDQSRAVLDPLTWFSANIGTERDWQFVAEPSAHVNGRALTLPMGRLVGGGSSINAMIWARGHREDFDYWARVTGDDAWNYRNAVATYLRVEDFAGPADPVRRGSGGRIYVEPTPNASALANAFLEGCEAVGIPRFADANGVMMEGDGGAALANLRVKDGKRQNIPASYLWDHLGDPRLTVATGATVHRISIDRAKRATGVTVVIDGELRNITASTKIVLAAGAINTPKILMLSGIGRAQDLAPLGITIEADLQGVGQNFQDHILAAGCNWAFPDDNVQDPLNNGGEANFFWKSDSALDRPDLQPFVISYPYYTDTLQARHPAPPNGWAIAPGLVSPASRGQVRIASTDPEATPVVDAGFLQDPRDLEALTYCVDLCRDIGNSAPLRPFVKREVVPGPGRTGREKRDFARNSAWTYFHQSCTAKMGVDDMSVTDPRLNVYGIEGLCITDASVMPRVTTGNTMAPTVVIAERCADILTGKA